MSESQTGTQIAFAIQGILAGIAGFFSFFSSVRMMEWFLNEAMGAVGAGTVYVFSPILPIIFKTAGALLLILAWLSLRTLTMPRLRRPLAQTSLVFWGFILAGTLWNMLMPMVRHEIPLFLLFWRMGVCLAFILVFWLFFPRAEGA